MTAVHGHHAVASGQHLFVTTTNWERTKDSFAGGLGRQAMASFVEALQEEEEEGFYKFLPANTADRLCQSWQSCSNHHEI